MQKKNKHPQPGRLGDSFTSKKHISESCKRRLERERKIECSSCVLQYTWKRAEKARGGEGLTSPCWNLACEKSKTKVEEQLGTERRKGRAKPGKYAKTWGELISDQIVRENALLPTNFSGGESPGLNGACPKMGQRKRNRKFNCVKNRSRLCSEGGL